MKKEKYEGVLVPSNMSYFYDDVIYSSNGIKGFREGVKYTYYSYSQSILPGGRVPEKPKPGEQLQIAVSKGFVDSCFNGVLPIGSTLSITGVTRIPSSTSAIVTGIVNTDELAIYTPPTSQSELYSNLISSSFKEGGFLMLYTSNNPDITAEAYDLLMNSIVSNVSINNISYAKLKLVKDFISNNLFFFAGLFFVFCLFSILMIFNFVIINIKNSTRDIGIYMSLGFSGWKISLIYLFQVINLGLAAFIISIFGVWIFLTVLDAHFTSLSAVNLEIIKMSFLGTSIVLGIALLIPIISVIVPLYNLSRKNPVDVIKTI
jgi:ABC-type antimicrobial peptide transport system permease subunit